MRQSAHRSFVVTIFVICIAAVASAARGNGLYPIISRSDFAVRSPRFGKAVEQEINTMSFRRQLAAAPSMSVSDATVPKATLVYRPDADDPRVGIILMTFKDPDNRLPFQQLERLNDIVTAYAVQRLRGNSRAESFHYAVSQMKSATR